MSDPLELDPKSLVVLHLVNRCGSLSAAARELGWTHPAVSQHVRSLERRTGVSLVVRAGRGVRLTPDGELLCRHADALASELELARATAVALRTRQGGVVRVAAFPTACSTFLVDAIHRLAETDPMVRVEVQQAEPPQAMDLLVQGEADLAVIFDAPDHPHIETVEVGTDRIVAVLPRRDARSSSGQLALTALADDVVIAGCPTCQGRFTRAATAAGIAPELHHQVTDDYVLMQAMVAAGQGVAVLPELALRAHHRDDVVAVPISPSLNRHTSLAVRAGTATGPVAALRNVLVGAAQAMMEQ